MINPKLWTTTGSWITIVAAEPDGVEVTDAPKLRFRKSAVCTFTSGQIVSRYPNMSPPYGMVLEAGNWKASFQCVDGSKWDFEFTSREYFLQFCLDMDEAFRT